MLLEVKIVVTPEGREVVTKSVRGFRVAAAVIS